MKGTGTSYEKRFGLSDNQWQNILLKLRKSCKTGQDQKKKKIDTCFCVSIDGYYQILVFGEETGH